MHLNSESSLFSSIPIPKLYGISALGSVYEYTPSSRSLTPLVSTLNQTLLPTMRLRKDGILIPWTLEPQGEARLKQVIRDINLKEMVAGLPGELGFFDTTSTEDLSESSFLKVILSPCVWFVRISSIQNIPFIYCLINFGVFSLQDLL